MRMSSLWSRLEHASTILMFKVTGTQEVAPNPSTWRFRRERVYFGAANIYYYFNWIYRSGKFQFVSEHGDRKTKWELWVLMSYNYFTDSVW